jgi:hypothetical protein
VAFHLRELLKVIWTGIIGNAAWSVLIALVGSSSAVALGVKRSRIWLLAEHSLTLWGAVWALVGLLCLSAIVLLTTKLIKRFGHGRWEWDCANGEDVKIRLREYLDKYYGHSGCVQVTLNCGVADYDRSLKPGSSRRYLPEVLRERGWEIIHQGRAMIEVRRSHPPDGRRR